VRQNDGVPRGRPVLLLWDVDHTLIANGGVSKANYRLAFELLTGRQPTQPPETGGRTDVAIMWNLLAANGERAESYSWVRQQAALTKAGERNRGQLAARGHALPGAASCLRRLAAEPDIIQSVLTGNIEANARVKLETFGLDRWLDFSVGAFGAEDRVRARLVAIAEHKASQRYEFNPERDETVLIGDTPFDIEAGLDGGARVIGVATGGVAVGDLFEFGADAALEDLADVDQVMQAVMRVGRLGRPKARRHPVGRG
jgi:phosphoglycolate phosphatase